MKRFLLIALMCSGIAYGSVTQWTSSTTPNVVDSDIVITQTGSSVTLQNTAVTITATGANVDIYDNYPPISNDCHKAPSPLQIKSVSGANTTLTLSAAAGRVVTWHIADRELDFINQNSVGSGYTFQVIENGPGTIIWRIGQDPQ